jgi:sugar-specific transcriptional regulator TrmB
LTQLGFTPNEAQVYLALIQNGPIGASAIASATGLARTVVYPTLDALVDQGLVEAGHGYGSRFSAVPADRALRHLLLERERITTEVIDGFAALHEPAEPAPAEFIQVIRSPRAVAERFERLHLEVERQVDVFCKPPILVSPDNPAQDQVRRRGVRCRGLYEKATLDDLRLRPYLRKWIAGGEEARSYDGELPHKLAIFDRKVALMPLVRPGEQTTTVLIRHPHLVQTLSLAFEYLWEQSKPVVINKEEQVKAPVMKQRKRRSHGKKSRPVLSSANRIHDGA